jgi:signal transduction histidine kinase
MGISAGTGVEGPTAGERLRRLRSPTSTLRLPIAAVVLCGLATFLVIAVPPLHFAYRQQELHVALETSAALIGLLASYLVFGRFRRQRHLNDLVLCYSLALLAFTNFVFAVLPSVVGDDSTRFSIWTAVSGRMLGTVGFAIAAFASTRTVLLTRAQATGLALSLPALLGAVAVTVALAGSHLPRGVEALAPPEDSGRPHFVGDAGVLAIQLAAMALYVAAAFGFARRAAKERDEFAQWLAVAAVFAAFARLNYFLYPSLYTEWVYTGDFFRLAFYGAILGAIAREIGSYWKRMSRAAALEERRRIARDLHDGLAQELAYITRNLQRLDRADPNVERLTASAARALDESRRAIAALTRPLDVPLDRALATSARETAEREGARLVLELDPNVEVDYERREALIRITCEAIANAARHSGSDAIHVELRKRDRVTLRVVDTGSGFDPEVAASGNGFGVVSMRERAAAVGGTFRLSSGPEGTTVEVVV